jgi:methylase of polypeptide subunit release factors
VRRQGTPATLLEVGCGTGNTVFPLLAANADLFVHCCDFAASAVELVKSNAEYRQDRCHAFQADITQQACFESVAGDVPRCCGGGGQLLCARV